MSKNVNFPRLFSTINLRGHTLCNRIVFGAHTTNMAEQGLPGERHLAYYRERALGGAAMLVIEPMPVHPAAVLTRGNFRNSTDEVIPHFRKITDSVHEEGSLILQQLYHVGQHGDADNSYHANWSPLGKDELKTFAPASHVIKCAGEDVGVTIGFHASSIHLPAVNSSGVEIVFKKRKHRNGYW